MNKTLIALTVILALGTVPAFGHHAAEGIVDDEVYEMIDSLVADTPHADMTFENMGGAVQMTITTHNVRIMENLVDEGLLTYFSMLDGDVQIAISFDEDDRVTMTVTQDF